MPQTPTKPSLIIGLLKRKHTNKLHLSHISLKREQEGKGPLGTL